MKIKNFLFLLGVMILVGSLAAAGLIVLLYGPAATPWIQIIVYMVIGVISLFASAVILGIATIKKIIANRRK